MLSTRSETPKSSDDEKSYEIINKKLKCNADVKRTDDTVKNFYTKEKDEPTADEIIAEFDIIANENDNMIASIKSETILNYPQYYLDISKGTFKEPSKFNIEQKNITKSVQEHLDEWSPADHDHEANQMKTLPVDLFRSNIKFNITTYNELVTLNIALKDEIGRYSYISDSKKSLNPLGVLLNNAKVLNCYLKDILKIIAVPNSILDELFKVIEPMNEVSAQLKLKGCHFNNKTTSKMESIGVTQNHYNQILKWINTQFPGQINMQLRHKATDKENMSVFLMENKLKVMLNSLVIVRNEAGDLFGCFLHSNVSETSSFQYLEDVSVCNCHYNNTQRGRFYPYNQEVSTVKPVKQERVYKSLNDSFIFTLKNPWDIKPTAFYSKPDSKLDFLVNTGSLILGNVFNIASENTAESNTCTFPGNFIDTTAKGVNTFTNSENLGKITDILIYECTFGDCGDE